MASDLDPGEQQIPTPKALARDLDAGIKAYGGQQIPKAFVEETSIKLALESQGSQKIHRHTEVTLDQGGMSEMIDRIEGKAPSNFRTYVDYDLNYETKTATMTGFIEGSGGAAKETSQVEIEMDPSHSQTFTLKDDDRNVILKAYGSCLSNGTGTDACNLSISGKFDATLEGSRTWLTSDHSKAHYVLHPAGNPEAKLASMNIETQLVGKKIIMDVDINSD
jgi:hypothetical protein